MNWKTMRTRRKVGLVLIIIQIIAIASDLANGAQFGSRSAFLDGHIISTLTFILPGIIGMALYITGGTPKDDYEKSEKR